MSYVRYYEDLTDMRFGKLTVIKKVPTLGDGNTRWVCKCDCGKVKIIRRNGLKRGTKSCGKACLNTLVGKRFGKVVVLEMLKRIFQGRRHSRKNGKIYRDRNYKCKCDCGKVFTLTRSQLKHKVKIAMCNDCRHPDLTGMKFNKLLVLRKSRVKRRRRTFWICKCDCGKIKAIDGSMLKAGIKKGATHRVVSCGCHRKYIKSGKRSNFWRNGNFASGKCGRLATLRYKCIGNRWRREVLNRDKFVCQHCGFISKDKKGLAAHHIWSFTKYWKKRFKADNGITLCKTCHKKFHDAYGKDGNTPHQFTRFQASIK